MRQIP